MVRTGHGLSGIERPPHGGKGAKMAASFTKLRDGSWGLRFEGKAPPSGAPALVKKSNGTVETVLVGKVIWSGNGITLTTIGGGRAAPSSRSSGSGHKCRNGKAAHDGPCCSGRHSAGTDCGCDCCDLD